MYMEQACYCRSYIAIPSPTPLSFSFYFFLASALCFKFPIIPVTFFLRFSYFLMLLLHFIILIWGEGREHMNVMSGEVRE